MAKENNPENFTNHAFLGLEDTAQNSSTNTDAFAWSHKKKSMKTTYRKKEKLDDTSFSYHPVTNFKEDDLATAEPTQKRIDPARPTYQKQHLQYTDTGSEAPNHNLPQRKETFSARDKDFSGYNFSGKDLTGADFSGANLRGVDFSGAILENVNFTNCDLTGAIFSGAILRNANFYKAKLHDVTLHNADIENAILLEADLDNLTIEELQELVEFLAINFPHKVNLSRLNLFMLDLKRIDLRNLDLRGVDFTGIDFTGINVFELDLSECIISPAQIAQALGRVPTPLELKQILAPKKKKKAKGKPIVDLTEFFLGHNREVGIDDVFRNFSSMDKLLEAGKRVVNAIAPKPSVKDERIIEKFEEKHHEEQSRHNEDLRRAIEENKRAVLEQRRLEKEKEEREALEAQNTKNNQHHIDPLIMQRGPHERR